MPLSVLCLIQYRSMQPLILPGNVLNETDLHAERDWGNGGVGEWGSGGMGEVGWRGAESENKSEKLTSEPAAAQLIRLLLGLAIQKVEVALQRGKKKKTGKKRENSLFTEFQTNS